MVEARATPGSYNPTKLVQLNLPANHVSQPLPTSREEALARGWDEVDVVFVTGDAYIDHPSFAKLRGFEELSLRTPIERHREALADAGAPITNDTYGSDSARRGILST